MDDFASARVGALAIGIVSLAAGLLTASLTWDAGVLMIESGLDELRLVRGG